MTYSNQVLRKFAGEPMKPMGEVIKALKDSLKAHPLAAVAAVPVMAGTWSLANLLEERYKAHNMPTWEAEGQYNLYNNHKNMYDNVRAKELMYNLKYETPRDFVQSAARQAGQNMPGAISNLAHSYGAKMSGGNGLYSTDAAKALGRARAKNIVDQVTKINPMVVTKYPGVAESVLNNAVATGTTAIQPAMASDLQNLM